MMSDAFDGVIVLGIVILVPLLVSALLVSLAVMILYSMNWTVFGFTPTTHDAIVSLFVLSILGGLGSSSD